MGLEVLRAAAYKRDDGVPIKKQPLAETGAAKDFGAVRCRFGSAMITLVEQLRHFQALKVLYLLCSDKPQPCYPGRRP